MIRLRLTFVLALCTSTVFSQLAIDPQLAAAIAKIKAIDNHAHPVRVTAANEKDTDYDALPVEVMEPYTDPIRLRPGNPDTLAASRSLFGGLTGGLSQARQKLKEEKDDAYPALILDRLGIETMLANRVSMGRGLASPRFLWVPFADALMYPISNSNLAAKNPDYKAFYEDEDRLLRRYLIDAGYIKAPASFDEYLQKVVTATLEQHKKGGAVAEKFEAAYLRSLDFGDAPKAEAERIYGLSKPGDAEYKALQDFLFRFIARECGRLGMAVHLHAAAGAGGYFHIGGANPLLLESVLNDPALRKTNFVLIHGGWPFTREMTALLQKPNAYADFSEQTFFNYPREVAQVIRAWLEFAPEKVLFATDAYPFSEEMSWEEAGWLASRTGRQALGLALTGMLRDGEITRARAIELAKMVLRDNARKLYGLP